MKKLPDLEAWAIFAKVAETGSFARAAQDFSLSQATVSKAITRLETRMKTVLFHRTSRRIALTENGLAALERASRILQEGEAVEADVMDRSTSLRGLIRVAAPMSFGIQRLAPLLPDFMQQHPEVELDLSFNDQQMDLIGERVDLALRIANLVDSSLLARKMCNVKILLVGSPAYFAKYGHPQHPRDLAQHRGLIYTQTSTGSNWRFHHARHGSYTQPIPELLKANNADALTPALLAGLGLALQPSFLVWQELSDGRLQTTLPGWEADVLSLSIVTPPGRTRPARVQAFMDYAAQEFRSKPWARVEEECAVLEPPSQ